MQDFFRVEGPFYRVMLKIWGLFVLNLLMLVTSLPILTMGASQTAGFTVTIRMISLGETRIVSTYFQSFKENLKQSTIVWSGMLVLSGILIINWSYLSTYNQLNSWVMIGVAIVTLIVANFFQFVFFYISRFEDSTKQVVINITKLPFHYPIRTLLLLLISIIPIIITLLSPYLVVFGLYISIFIGISFIHFLRTYLLLGLFRKI
ncbi:YesL family protein [Desemzia sp. RIT804]|uniref:YesL family protein n=1 Tax=Desemzia sp. RIT 804 TaxID=2810209 RepID=UPI00195236F1|nr:YesL family protein [Desemzia sp. RIT 804]MBM6615006.1 YesL family protein [Desemzia sp. RIT 804]